MFLSCYLFVGASIHSYVKLEHLVVSRPINQDIHTQWHVGGEAEMQSDRDLADIHLHVHCGHPFLRVTAYML